MRSVSELVAAAKAGIENLSPADVAAEIERGEVVIVDVREPAETEAGVIDGAIHAPRGMLEFHADASTPYHLEELAPERRVIVYCAAGSRSALAAAALQELGYRDAAHLEGGFKAWVEAGHPVTKA